MPATAAKIDRYITRSFRDVADTDYISARALYRVGLDYQFLWAALQAIEKYLKAILLYNRRNTKDLSHDIARALQRVRGALGARFEVSDTVETFIVNLGRQGVDRYFEQPINTDGLGLLGLDRAVWEVRKYCRAVTEKGAIDGALEETLGNPSPTRDNLIWKNLYFGRYKTIKFRRRFKIANPSTFISPEIFEELDKIIHFSKPVREHFSV